MTSRIIFRFAITLIILYCCFVSDSLIPCNDRVWLIILRFFKKKKFHYPVTGWGMDLQSEHERYLVEKHFKKPVILINYPKEIKAFYMRQNDDSKTVAAMDILAPGIGEIVGGSQREERLDKLIARMQKMHVPVEDMQWYLDTRRFGSVPHAGFGMGIERAVTWICGLEHVRETIPFPRMLYRLSP